MSRTRNRGSRTGSRKSKKAVKKVLTSNFQYYKPNINSDNIPIIVFDDINVMKYEELKACILDNSEADNDFFTLHFLTGNFDFYAIVVSREFARIFEQYKFCIVTDREIYLDDTKDGIIIPIYIQT